MSDLIGLRALYAHTAHLYEQAVAPAFGPLATDLARWVLRCVAAHRRAALHDPFDDLGESLSANELNTDLSTLTALDLGTGTGLLARALSPALGRVIGLDVSPDMLRVAQRAVPGNVRLLAGDLHHLPFRRGAVQLIVSSFGLNASTPKKAFRAIARVLRPGQGVLAFQEWAAEDDVRATIDRTLQAYAPPDIPGLGEALRHFLDAPSPWNDQLQYSEDFYEMLKETGFDLVWAREAHFVTVRLPSIDALLNYRFAWPMRRFTLEAMTPQTRAAFLSDVRARLAAFANADGSVDWTPSLFRVFATM
jgi:ubiquinone/menaquinone biosynthesis C-methylase UbiE